MSISDTVLNTVWETQKSSFASFGDFINAMYAKIAQGFVYYRWLITYLFGASPLAEQHFFKPGEGPTHYVRSLRSSNFGLSAAIQPDFTSVRHYVNSIEDNIQGGKLFSEAEYHGSVRIKSATGHLQDMLKNGADYLEIRMLDLDPSTAVGVRTSTVRFFRILLTYFMMTDPLAPADQINGKLTQGIAMNEVVAMENPMQQTIYHHEAQTFIDQLQQFGATIQWGPEYQEVLDTMQDRIDNPRQTPSATLCDHIVDESLTSYALMMANRYQRRARENPRPFTGFQNHPDMSVEELRQQLFGVNGRPEKFSSRQSNGSS
ncbi:hypothetical protein [uncultured Secundilactobacillus sp.]|uniref:hypothetical protein n=1 Tax=uncultured Secundilactobacillus sp. TaxID=2813935 RepID=UPI0025852145|nr:hypothetical protein [uncultured Secundilactobacillus sp.]